MIPLPTQYAPAERVHPDEIVSDYRFFNDDLLLREMFDAIPSFVIILNEKRQVVFANKSTRETFGSDDGLDLPGKRPGEILKCIHADETESGCGTTTFCRYCGSVEAILSSLKGKESVQECRIVLQNGDALDLRVWATPKQFQGKSYSIVVLDDISHEKRRRALERIFFHDIMNTAGGLHGILEILSELEGDELKKMLLITHAASRNLIEEIEAQRILSVAESNELKVQIKPVDVITMLEDIKAAYMLHEVAKNRRIVIDTDVTPCILETDPVLLKRVLGNMLKNALEATDVDLSVTLGFHKGENDVVFWVHNPGYMPEDVQHQLFQRSFSTKGSDRGLGTYSMRLLTERYLGGTISFTSRPDEGTTFRVRLPSGPGYEK